MLRRFFGNGIQGAESRSANFEITEGVTKDILQRYASVAQKAIDAGKDRLGVQAKRLELIRRAMKGIQ